MLENIRTKLASIDALPLLSGLGVLAGLVTGAVIIVFRIVIESSQVGIVGLDDPENYESLSSTMRFLLPALGGLIIGIIFSRINKKHIQVGVVHVLERLNFYQGHLPYKNFLLQFVGAAISIVCGHSVGREGPGIHLGAAGSSLIAQALKLPNNTGRILVGCGAAASIAASFNTPIAGVIFAMEVILMEYSIAGFTPIILATVSATVLTRFVFGDSPAFVVPPLEMATMYELPILFVMGVVMGAMSAFFIQMMKFTTERTNKWPIIIRTTIAGVCVGICAIIVPEIMGIGYDTVNAAMLGQLGLGMLVLLVLFKLLATTVGLGLGLPGGLIGPTMVIGAAGGGLIGLIAETLFTGNVASAGFYAMIGMGAMMGATLQAPLAALLAMLELTVNTNIILPGMFVVIVAGLTSSHLFKQQGIFLTLLKARGLDYKHDPITQSLRRQGVASAMTTSFLRVECDIDRDQLLGLLKSEPQWLVLEDNNQPLAILNPADVVTALNKDDQESAESDSSENETDETINLMEIPGQRFDCVQVNIRATLQQALAAMDSQHVDMVYIGQAQPTGQLRIHGLLSRQMIESHY